MKKKKNSLQCAKKEGLKFPKQFHPILTRAVHEEVIQDSTQEKSSWKVGPPGRISKSWQQHSI